MKLTPASYVLLGMLRIGARSGYDIKRVVELSVRFFWTLSPVQIYPELKRLEEAGLVTGRDEPRGGRPRRVYGLTPEGEEALREWVRGPEELTMEMRDLGLLKMFFADAVREDDALALVRRFRERSERMIARFHNEILPAAESKQEIDGTRFPLIAARFGLGFHEWAAQWCAELERELAAGPAVRAARR